MGQEMFEELVTYIDTTTDKNLRDMAEEVLYI